MVSKFFWVTNEVDSESCQEIGIGEQSRIRITTKYREG
jgi:hypothetical protein